MPTASQTVPAYKGSEHQSATTSTDFGIESLVAPDLDALFVAPLLARERSAWFGHVPFAHWCMQHMSPSVFVELGTHSGISYSAFCQAAKQFKIDCRCHAVDTWEGDAHASRYGSEIYDTVKAHNDEQFAEFSTLHKCTFDEALQQFEDGSVDLLHIDGFHSYEAVRHDFETWRSKLSDAGVVLFHDTNEHREGFGVWKFWQEVREDFPWFEFEHAHGLGVLAVGENVPPAIAALCALTGTNEMSTLQRRLEHLGERWVAESLLVQREKKFEQASASAREKLKELGQSQRALRSELDKAESQAQAVSSQLSRNRQQLVASQARVKAITSSSSWHLTGPLRQVAGAAKAARVIKPADFRSLVRAVKKPAELKSALRAIRAIAKIRSSPMFDTQWYLSRNPDVAQANLDPVRHFVFHGSQEGRRPSESFDPVWYLSQYPDVVASGMNPLFHYLIAGKSEGRLCLAPGVESPKSSPSSAIDAARVRARQELIVAKRLADLEGFRAQISQYHEAREDRDPGALKVAVYTAICSGYDTVKQPTVLNPDFDYFLFTDTPVFDVGIWQIKPITYFGADSTRSARYVKTHPHLLLPGYDLAIWLDSNIQIHGDLTGAVSDFLNSGKPFASVRHPLRDDIYQEVAACSHLSKDEPLIMKTQAERYKEEGFEHSDLIESNWMMLDLRSPKSSAFLDVWWREIDRHSRRDQLSINYSLSQAGVDWHTLTKPGTSVRESPLLAYSRHDGGQGVNNLLAEKLRAPIVDPYDIVSFASHKEELLKSVEEHRVAVVVCVHNALADVKLCLNSVDRSRSRIASTLVIVDDGSDTETRDWLLAFSAGRDWVMLLRNEVASGYTRAANLGVRQAQGDLVVLLNSDTIVTSLWAEKLAQTVFSTPGAGIVGPLSNAASHQSIPDITSVGGQTAINALPPGVGPEQMNQLCEQWSGAGLQLRVPLIHGFCIGITRAVLDRIGCFDEVSFPNGYGEENDLCMRATNAGFSLALATNTFVFHAKSKSYDDVRRRRLMKAGSVTLRRLHGAERISRSVKSMQGNPVLQRFRDQARLLALSSADSTDDRQSDSLKPYT